MTLKPPEWIRIPQTFFDDHQERDLPTPWVQHNTKQHYWILPTDPALGELVNDAEHYASPYGPETPWLRTAAKALLKAISVHKARSK